MKSVAEELHIFDQYSSYERIPPRIKAVITKKSIERGKNPIRVHAGIKSRYVFIRNTIYD